jgi:hypothetical protein
MVRSTLAALAVAATALTVAPAAHATTSVPLDTYICIHYTYIWVAGNRVPTVQSVSIQSTPYGCDQPIKVL